MSIIIDILLTAYIDLELFISSIRLRFKFGKIYDEVLFAI